MTTETPTTMNLLTVQHNATNKAQSTLSVIVATPISQRTSTPKPPTTVVKTTLSTTSPATTTSSSKLAATSTSLVTPTLSSTSATSTFTPSHRETTPDVPITLNSTSTTLSTSEIPSSSKSTATLTTATATSGVMTMYNDGNTKLCSTVHQNHANKYGTVLGQFGEFCYELMPEKKLTWDHGEQLCSSGGGHLISITSSENQGFIESFLQRHFPSHAVWIGLHDRNTEELFQWTSGASVTYTNWIAGRTSNFVSHDQEDCVVLVPYKGGKWDDIPCGYSSIFGSEIGEVHPIICQFKTATSGGTSPDISLASTTISSIQDGNTRLCDSSHQQHALTHNNVLGQFGQYCYELMTAERVAWNHGEQLCQASQGHLAAIASSSVQGFLGEFLRRHSPQHAVWIGLHDTNIENHFEWTDGNDLTYSNWIPGHVSNFADHSTEDCVAMIPYKDGQWDDIPCGYSGFGGTDIGERHLVLCQYKITASAIIG